MYYSSYGQLAFQMPYETQPDARRGPGETRRRQRQQYGVGPCDVARAPRLLSVVQSELRRRSSTRMAALRRPAVLSRVLRIRPNRRYADRAYGASARAPRSPPPIRWAAPAGESSWARLLPRSPVRLHVRWGYRRHAGGSRAFPPVRLHLTVGDSERSFNAITISCNVDRMAGWPNPWLPFPGSAAR